MTEEEEAINELMAMPRAELDMVPHDLKKCLCNFKNCIHGMKVRDYGIHPVYYLHRKEGRWINVENQFYLCGPHYKFYKKLTRLYDEHHIERRILEKRGTKIITIKS